MRSIRFLLSAALLVMTCSVFADDLSVGEVKMTPGKTNKLSIVLNNSSSQYTAFQFDLVLPEGLTVAKNPDESFIAEIDKQRIVGHTLKVGDMGSNVYRFLAYSDQNKDLTGTSGALVNVSLQVAETVSEGSVDCSLQNIIVAKNDGVGVSLDDSKFNVKISSSEKVKVSVGSFSKSMLVSDSDLDFSGDDVKAYIVSGCEGTTIWLTRVMDVPAGTPVLLMGDAGDYNIPVTTSFTHYPQNLLRGSATAASPIVPDENGYVNMYLSKKDGTFVKFASETTFPAGMSYLHMPVTSFAAPIAGDAQSIEIPSSGKYTYCPPVDLDFTNVDGGLKAYTATGFEKSGKLWLTKVNKVQAGTALLLKGDAGSYSVPAVGSQTEFANLVKGSATESTSLSTTTGEYTNYYVNKSGAFVLFGETPVDYPAGRSYLQIPTAFLAGGSAGTRSVEPVVIDSEDAEVISMEVSFGDGTTGIDAVGNSYEQDVYYNLQGQRIDNPGKGPYIKNGKKIFVK